MRISDWSSDVCSSDLDLRFLRELQIADIGPQPPADAELDRNDDDIVALQIIGSEAADEIEFALDLRKALEQTLGVIKVIDERERLRRTRADVKTDGRPGRTDRTLALHLAEHRPRAITQAHRECAAPLPAAEIAMGLAISQEVAL